jgi:hypothetical protein
MEALGPRLDVPDIFSGVAVEVFTLNSPLEELSECLHKSICCFGSICLGIAQLTHVPWLYDEGLVAMLLHKRV